MKSKKCVERNFRTKSKALKLRIKMFEPKDFAKLFRTIFFGFDSDRIKEISIVIYQSPVGE